MRKSLRVLIVEDSEDDALLLMHALRRGPWDVSYQRVDTARDMSVALDEGGWDLILADYSMPRFSGPAALSLTIRRGSTVPFILISGVVDEEIAVQSMKAGADDYIAKHKLARLVPAVERELHKAAQRLQACRTEEQSRASEGRYRTLFECAPDGILIEDESSYYIDANPSMCRMLGYDRSELIGLHASSIIFRSELPCNGPLMSAVNSKAAPDRIWEFRRKDGSRFPAEVITTTMPDGKTMGMVRDISDLMRVEAALAETTASIQDALHEISFQKFALDQHAIVAITDAAGRINYANDKFCEISGYSREELLGKDHRILNSGTHSKQFFKELYSTIARGLVWRGEICNRAKDGHLYWVDTTIVPSKDERGRITRYVAIRADISERKTAEKELERVNDQLIKQNKNLLSLTERAHRFVDDVSHEFRTPLAIIKEFGAIVADGLAGPVTADQANYLDIMDNAVLDLNQMVEDFLDSSKLRAGLLRVDRQPQNVADIFARIRPGLLKKAASRSITITEKIDPDVPPAFADEEKARRVIMNLATNAIKFSPEGSQVQLWARRASEGRIDVGVTDHGRGLTPTDLAQLFERFRQLPSSQTASIKGFGLGLNIARQLVWLNLGRMKVASEEGKGSTFSFTLPEHEPRTILDCFLSGLSECEDPVTDVSVMSVSFTGDPAEGIAVRMFLAATTRPADIILCGSDTSTFVVAGPTNCPGGWASRLAQMHDQVVAKSGNESLPEIRVEILGTFPFPALMAEAKSCVLERLQQVPTHV